MTVKKSDLSYSSWQKFWTCPAYYDWYKNKKLEPVGTTSALRFGTAIDEGLSALYVDKVDPVEVFQKSFTWESMVGVEFSKKDLDRSVFTEEQSAALKGENDDYVSWASLRVKGRALLEQYMIDIFPLMISVHGVQHSLNQRTGFIDLLASVTLVNGEKVVIDHKTANWPYSEESASEGAQLILYAEDQGIKNTAYCVLLKDIWTVKTKTCVKCGKVQRGGSHKTCPELSGKDRCHGELTFSIELRPKIQMIIGRPSKQDTKDVVKSFELTEKMIEWCDENGYPKNMSACDWIYGKRCPYFAKCRKGDGSGLNKRKEKK